MGREISAKDVSVIIPLYNRASMLTTILNSVYQQTVQPGEIIIIDDGSSDDPETVLNQSPDSRIRFRKQPNGGPGKARNTGIELATGKLIAFLDSDDIWLPEKLEKQLALWNKLKRAGKECVLMDTYICRTNNGKPQWSRRIDKRGSSFDGLLLENTINGTSSVLCDREAVLKAGGFPTSFRFAEDRFLWLSLAREGEFYTVPEMLVIKNHEGDNLTEDVDGNVHEKLAFIEKVRREFNVSPKSYEQMKLLALAEFMMMHWRRREYRKAGDLACRMTANGKLWMLAGKPKIIAVLALMLALKPCYLYSKGVRK